MLWIKPGWLPASVGITMATGAIVSYVIAVVRGDVTPYVPYISEAGGKPPESGIFALALIISSFFSIMTIYGRYLVVKDLNKECCKEMNIFNFMALICGFLSTLGACLVAAYPVTMQELAHNVGANTLFISGVIYSTIQTRISFKMCPQYNGATVCWVRLIITLVSIAAMAIIIIYDPMAKSIWLANEQKYSKEFRVPGDQGFSEFLVASIAEWILAISFIFFFYTFIREFNKLYIQFKAVPLVNHFDDEVTKKGVWFSDEARPILFG